MLEFYDSNDIPFIKPDDFKTIDEISSSKGNKNYISENARNNARIVPQNSVLVTCIGVIGKVMISESELSFNQQINAIVPNELILSKYLAYLLLYNKSNLDFISNAPVVPIINKTQFSEFEVTFHENIDVQEMIIQKLENLDNQILKRRHQSKLLSNLVKSRFNEMFGDFYTTLFPKYKIGEKFELSSGSTPSRDNKLYWDSGTINWVKTTEVINKEITETEEKITKFALENTSLKLFPVNTILIAMYGQGQTRGRSAILKVKSTSNQACGAIFPNKIDNPVFIWHQLMLRYSELRELGRGGNQPNLNGQLIKNFELIFPPLSLQNEFADFVAQVDKSQFACQIVIKLWRNSLKSSII
ncbi:restriction endonuclease subunit S [Streptococcus mitis]|uniref:restriction endonuclease subunit S n=1 Tax=Streptococcus mitis TaxID=28037 RepID=UPI0024141D08|nr:restriction endonuclease subunit S [Streptococcus mitis]